MLHTVNSAHRQFQLLLGSQTDGFCPNRSGARPLYFLNRHSVPTDQHNRQENPKQQDKTEPWRNIGIKQHQCPPGDSLPHEIDETKKLQPHRSFRVPPLFIIPHPDHLNVYPPNPSWTFLPDEGTGYCLDQTDLITRSHLFPPKHPTSAFLFVKNWIQNLECLLFGAKIYSGSPGSLWTNQIHQVLESQLNIKKQHSVFMLLEQTPRKLNVCWNCEQF